MEALASRLGAHTDLSAADIAAITSLAMSERRLERGSYVVREGDRPSQCSLLVEGYVIRQKLASDGGRQIVAIQMAGDLIDLQNLMVATADHSVQALTPIRIFAFSRDALLALLVEHPAVGRAIMRETIVECSIAREWMTNVGRRQAPARIAHLLCELAYRIGCEGSVDDYSFEMPMTQEQIADSTGLTPVHVNRSIKLLDDMNLIERSRRSIRIVDLRTLADFGDFRSRYLHIPRERDARELD